MQVSMLRPTINLILLLLATAVASTGVAQRYTFSPSNTWEAEYYMADEKENQIDIVNETTEVLAFKWRMIKSTFPAEWSWYFCDLGSCFINVPDSNEMDLTTAGGDAYFLCHMEFNGFVGTGEFQVFVFEIGDEVNGDTVTFRYATTNVLGVEEYGGKSKVLLYPNPASDVLNLSMQVPLLVDQITVHNILGQPVYAQKGAGTELSVAKLPAGQYLLTLAYRDGTRETRKFLKKP